MDLLLWLHVDDLDLEDGEPVECWPDRSEGNDG